MVGGLDRISTGQGRGTLEKYWDGVRMNDNAVPYFRPKQTLIHRHSVVKVRAEAEKCLLAPMSIE